VNLALGLAVWGRSADEVPIHWNFAGQADDWAPKAAGLLLTPALALGVYVLLTFLPRFDPMRANYARFAGAYTATRALVLTVFVAVQAMIVAAAAGRDVRAESVMPVVVGSMFVVLGFLLPRFEPNWFAGIRTPWTLSNPEVWRRTHRVGGAVFIAMGTLVVIAGLLGDPEILAFVIAGAVAAAFGLVGYSYIVWRQLRNGA
jgi:uncharacterized membrane protein